MADGMIYHNPRCSTSRKTLELLRDNGIEPTVVEYLKAPPTRAELATMMRPFVVTAKGTRLGRPVDVVREIL